MAEKMAENQLALMEDIKARFIAWWHGYNPPGAIALEEYKRCFLEWWNGYVNSGATPSFTNAPPRVARKAAAPPKRRQEIHARGIVSQALWGEGNLTPGTAEFVAQLTSRLGLSPEMSMLDLGAGLGGPARAISSAYGIWVTAYEAVPLYVKIGMEQSVMHGMAKKVAMSQFETETVKLPQRKFDCVFSKEMMHHIQIKERLLQEIEQTLKTGGQFFLTNYVVTGNGNDSPHVAAWNEADKQDSKFWTKDDYVAALAKAKLDLRVSEDLTPQYCEMIAEGFRGLKRNMDRLIEEETDPKRQSELLHALAFESNRWAVRAEALNSGDFAVYRFSGMKPVGEIR